MFPLNIKPDEEVEFDSSARDTRSCGDNFGWFPVSIDSKSYLVDVDVVAVDALLREYVSHAASIYITAN